MARKFIIYLLCLALAAALCALALGLAMMVGSKVPNLIHARVSYENGVFLFRYGCIVVLTVPVVYFVIGLLVSMMSRSHARSALTLQPAE